MKKQVYIIGNPNDEFNLVNETKYYRAQLNLIEMGFNVINPFERIGNSEISEAETKRKNIKDLMFSDAVYIMPDVELSKKILKLKLL